MFTVELNCLQDSGYYWCAVEIGGSLDDKDYLYLTASADPAVSATNSRNSAVLVSDDGKGAVRVEMRGLQKSDAGWYWFSAGDVGVTVHLTVATIGGDEMRSKDEGSQLDDTTLALTIIAGLFLLLTLVGLVIWKVKHKDRYVQDMWLDSITAGVVLNLRKEALGWAFLVFEKTLCSR
ncbi:hypothetical protein AOLI_G00214420 [Acnodon oligacanthus]